MQILLKGLEAVQRLNRATRKDVQIKSSDVVEAMQILRIVYMKAGPNTVQESLDI